MEPIHDHAATIGRALAVLRAWEGGAEDNLPLALQEAQFIIEEDGSPDQLLAGLINAAGFLLVNLEQRGQPSQATLELLEAFMRSQQPGDG